MSLVIGLTFGIFVSDNGKVPRSMRVLLLWISYDFLSILYTQNYKMSIFTQVPFGLFVQLCCNISIFFNVSFALIYRSLMMRSGLKCPLAIMKRLSVPLLPVLWGDYTWKYICYRWKKNASVFIDTILFIVETK